MITLCLNQPGTDPYFNLAAEEYFLKNFQEDFFMLWRSEPSVVVGKHQNALAEINHAFVRENHIPVARRLSGGGTVFHDPGNVNFTFIRNVSAVSEVNFKLFTEPVIGALKKLGVEAYSTGRNDLLIDGKKISGNAEHVHKNRVLHHGTLLFNSRLETLKGALNADSTKFEDKAVQSNRSEVTNIANYLSSPVSVKEFTGFLFREICGTYRDFKVYPPTAENIAAIEKCAAEKYRTWDWIFGYSPRYSFTNEVKAANGVVSISLLVEKGRITSSEVSGAVSDDLQKRVVNTVLGCRHWYDDLRTALQPVFADLIEEGIDANRFLNLFF